MTVQLLRQSKTFVMAQSRSSQKGTAKRVQHCDYVYVTDLPTNTGFSTADSLIDELEFVTDTEVYNIQLVLDDMTAHWTLRFSSLDDSLETEYELELPD